MKYITILYCALMITFMSCSKDLILLQEERSSNEIFQEFWEYVDEHYIYFEQKGVNWDDIYKKYSRLIVEDTSEEDLFDVCHQALLELKDAHNRIEAPFKKSENYDITQGYNVHFSRKVIRDNYLGGSWKQDGAILHKIMENGIGYMHIFQMSQYGKFDSILRSMKEQGVKGLIIDVRHNGGGDSNPVPELISNFLTEPLLLGYYIEKSGPAHNDFSEPMAVHSTPASDFYFDLPVVVLIDRLSYSAATYLASMFKEVPGVNIVGQITGGGGGGNYGYQLSNEWIIAVSASDFLNTDMQSIEGGVVPDVHVENTEEGIERGIDQMLEKSIEVILSN